MYWDLKYVPPPTSALVGEKHLLIFPTKAEEGKGIQTNLIPTYPKINLVLVINEGNENPCYMHT